MSVVRFVGPVCCVLLLSSLPLAGEESHRPWLGVEMSQAGQGVSVEAVLLGSPAEAAGLRAGDVVERAGGAPVSRPADLARAVEQAGIGSALALHVRGEAGDERDLQAVLVVRPNLPRLQRTQLVGHHAPDFSFRRSSGIDSASLRALRGKVVLLDFWAAWCRPCLAAMPHLQRLHERFKERGLRVLGIAADDWESARRLARERGVTYAQVSDQDGRIGSRYFISAIPTLVLISRDGRVIHVSIGELASIEAALDELL